jgi:DNA mismatch repair protein MutS2
MSMLIGSEVVVRTLGNKRGVIVDVARDGRFRVRVEGVTIWCREEDLASPPEERKSKRARQRRQDTAGAGARDEAAPAGRVDLHGLRIEEAIARSVDEIDRTLRRGGDRLEVVHGKGAGRIRDALHRHLASMPVVKAFKLDPRNPGVTWVYF